ncbi:MAG TPA: hypothetical protein VF818_08815 [Ktedonobacterales bacterium]
MENETTITAQDPRSSWARVRARGVWSACSLLIALALALTMASPAFAGGVVNPGISVNPGTGASGTSVTLSGTNFPPGDSVSVGYSTGGCSSGVTAIAGGTGTVDASGNVAIIFNWPDGTMGSYTICATDNTTHSSYKSASPFQALPAPTVTISNPVYSGQQVTVTGSHFLPTGSSGYSVEVLYGSGGSNGCATSTGGPITVAPDGSFTATFSAPHADSNTPITIVAVEPQGTCGQQKPGPVLQAQANASVSPSPAISVTNPVTAGQTITVSGKNFLPAGTIVEVDYGLGKDADACTTHAGTATVGQDGSFSSSFKAPSVSSDTPINIVAVAPQGSCAQPKLHAGATAQIKANPTPFPFLQYCLIGLLFLLLLLLLLFLLFRRNKKEEPVTIEERDRVYVSPNVAAGGGNPGVPGGTALIDRQIVARDRRGKEVVIAEEVTTVEEEEEMR